MRFFYLILLGFTFPALANTIVVHPQRGDDLMGNGTPQKPFRTVSHALALAQPGTTIVLQPGSYSHNSGEKFPWMVKSGITLRGNEAQQGRGVVVIGGAPFRSAFLFNPNVTIVLQDQTELRGLTITNPHARGYGVWQEEGKAIVANNSFSSSKQDGILLTGTSTPTIISNRFLGNRSSNITIEGDARPIIQQNLVQQAKFGITVRQQAVPSLNSNTISDNDNGIIVQGNSRPSLRGNQIINNRQTAFIALNDSNPDLGTAAAPGKNTFRANGKDIHNGSSYTLSVLGNQFDQANLFGKVTVDTTIVKAPPPPSPRRPFEPVPNSVVVKISGTAPRALGINSALDPNLPPVTTLPPPEGTIVVNTAPARRPTPRVPLKFRVVVPVASEAEKIALRQMLPGSFPLNRSGQEVVQVGAFNSMELAQAHVQQLANQGITAILEPLSP